NSRYQEYIARLKMYDKITKIQKKHITAIQELNQQLKQQLNKKFSNQKLDIIQDCIAQYQSLIQSIQNENFYEKQYLQNKLNKINYQTKMDIYKDRKIRQFEERFKQLKCQCSIQSRIIKNMTQRLNSIQD